VDSQQSLAIGGAGYDVVLDDVVELLARALVANFLAETAEKVKTTTVKTKA
jgi:hypothetical protein